jgi:hypothetical protein
VRLLVKQVVQSSCSWEDEDSGCAAALGIAEVRPERPRPTVDRAESKTRLNLDTLCSHLLPNSVSFDQQLNVLLLAYFVLVL